MMQIYLRCLNCGLTWKPKKKNPKGCRHCHSAKYEAVTEFTFLKEKLKPPTPKELPYRKNWGKGRLNTVSGLPPEAMA